MAPSSPSAGCSATCWGTWLWALRSGGPGWYPDGPLASLSLAPPEERERCLWCVVRTARAEPLGTIMVQVFHDHTCFRLPHPPGVLALEATDPQALIEVLAHGSVRMKGAAREEPMPHRTVVQQAQPGWEYSVEVGVADYLDPQHFEISEGLLDHALARWGRHGWELVTIVPYQARLIAFFKRPPSDNAYLNRRDPA